MFYKVNINQVWSENIVIQAKTASEARRLAWKVWKAKKKNYEIRVVQIAEVKKEM